MTRKRPAEGRELLARGVSRGTGVARIPDRAVEKPREEEAALTGAGVRGESSQVVGAALPQLPLSRACLSQWLPPR